MRSQHLGNGRDAGRDDENGLGEVAQIFAQGVLRLYKQGHLPLGRDGLSPQTALEKARQDLEQSAETRLSVHRGLQTETSKRRNT